MKKALPAIAVSAAGLTWLLHAQGVIDASVAPKTTNAAGSVATGAGPSGAAPTSRPASTTTTFPPRGFGGDDEDGPVQPRSGGSPTTTARPSTTAGPSQGGNGNRVSDGPVIDTRFGPVQVEAVLQGSKLVDVKVLAYPNEARRSQAINSQALPMLHDQAMSAQSAQIDGVSGATYTSTGYQQSLQAALDSAK